jgi:hypothetical protein
LADDLGFAFLRMGHRDDDALCARNEVHGAAHAGNHAARHHPVGEPSHLIDLKAPQHRQVQMAAADEAEGHGAVEGRSARQGADRAASGVGELLVLEPLFRQREHADDAVLRLEEDLDVARQIGGDERREADAEIDEVSLLELARDASGDQGFFIHRAAPSR